MDKKIFLDSGIMISLGKIHKFCGSDLSKLYDITEVQKILQKDSINIGSWAILLLRVFDFQAR